MNWIKLQPVAAQHSGCLHCGPRPTIFPPSGLIAVGFGYAALHKDGAPIWSEDDALGGDDKLMTGADAEALASLDPDHDWRILLHGPLSGRTYQRHDAGKWVLVDKSPGFA